jgi:hypothetical protein
MLLLRLITYTLGLLRERNTKMDFDKVLELMEEYGYELDNDGQVVIYTGIYEHEDGEFYDEPEESEEEED